MTNDNTQRKPIKRALISVYDKTGLEELARDLHEAGVEIVSTGSTAGKIAAAGVPVTPVEDLTGFPECLEGRVKTLHPRVHAGILADTRKEDHLAQLKELGVEAFQLVVVNLYPFRETVASGASYDECVEQIDIGGPSMVRAAAKNHPSVAIVVDPARYGDVATAVKEGGFTLEQRREFARDAFLHTADYDAAVSNWFVEQLGGAEGSTPTPLRYGENSHQSATLTRIGTKGLANAKQLNGKEMSYNNYQDADAAWRAAWDHERPCVAIIKHANPCGIAVSDESIAAAHRAAHACDPMSAFGGVIAVNREVSVEMAEQVKDIFTEVIVAPSFEPAALEVFKAKKNLRLLQLPQDWQQERMDVRLVSGGLLLQDADRFPDDIVSVAKNWELVSGERPSDEEMENLIFAWKACRAVKSNAIVLAKDNATVGVGMGQVNRVDSCRLAVERAGDRAAGSVAASDAFFPFADGAQVLIDAGVKAIVQPGGSVRDEEVVDAARKAGVTMFFTGERHFFH